MISVVVPIYNVERYLAQCLTSLARQTVADLEVVMVDDGSTDASAAIAEEFASRDERFRLVSQPNGGLSSARNTGAGLAQGEFLAFVDSDDVVPPDAYELLLGALDKTGSDFATGNVHRLTRTGTRQSPFLARTFAQTRLKTHVTKFRPLLADRIVPNKLWRRSFWDQHAFRFPEGVVHEDIPVVVPAQFLARSVDVIAEPVYLYRIREGGDLSITQRRTEQRVLLDRLAAIEHVSEFLARSGRRRARRWYDASAVADDLRYYLNALDGADDEYRLLFLERVNAFLDRQSDRIYAPLPAIDRLKWHLVRRRLMPELLEVLRFEREDIQQTPPVRVGRHWYGDYPFREDSRLRIPRSVYRVDKDLGSSARVDVLRREGEQLVVGGWAFINGIGAPAEGSQRVTVTALRPGPLRRVRLRLGGGVTLASAGRHRPDATASTSEQQRDVAWAGFEATLHPRRLRTLGRWRDGTWQLYVTLKAGGVKRRRVRFSADRARPLAPVELPAAALVRAARAPGGEIELRVDTRWGTVRGHRLVDGVLELTGDIRGAGGSALEVRRADGSARRRYKLAVRGGASGPAFTAGVPVADLLAAADPPAEEPHALEQDGIPWELHLPADGRRHPVVLAGDAHEGVWPCGDREVVVTRGRDGGASLVLRTIRGTVTEARWTTDGALELGGEARTTGGLDEVVVVAPGRQERYAFPVHRDPAPDRFAATLTPDRVSSLAGPLPLREGTWEICGRTREGTLVPLGLGEGLRDVVPLERTVEHKPFALTVAGSDRAVLVVQRDLDDDERGPFHQRRLRETAYAARRDEPLEDTVVFTSFRGRQYSDSPRAIHEELVRRGAGLEHLWVVRDGMCRVPETATVLRDGSREHHEALARARYVVTNDHFPDWFVRRPDQVCLQTWHGTPLKRLGLDVSEKQGRVRRFQRRWDNHVTNWQYVLSPNRFTTPILRVAYGIEGEMLEVGYPRNDVLARADRDALTVALRRRLGLPEDKRIVLYAPTYRDQVVDGRGRYRLDLHLEVERLRRAVGHDTVVLFRKHHYVVDAVPETADGFVRDVSAYPDGTELMLAADVLVTDYSSMMFDFANTGRPMLFFTYDLDVYRDEIRGFYFDFAAQAPGPLLRTTDELAAALRDLDGVVADHASRYDAFASTFCELDDGHAAARVVDRIFSC